MVHKTATALHMALNCGVLAYIKAFRQRADVDSIRHHVLGRYNSVSLKSAKDILWDGCKDALARLKLEKKTRRGSASRSQELADLDDILEAIDALDNDGCLPDIVCSSDDLLVMPQLLPLHSIEQVAENLRSFQEEVRSHLDAIEKSVSRPTMGSAAGVVSTPRSAPPTSGTSSQRQVLDPLERRCNIVVFGVPEDKDISVVADVLQTVAGAKIPIKDTFRLGKKASSSSHTASSLSNMFPSGTPSPGSSRPRPILVKLSCPWDRRIILANKKKLSETEGMERYFLQPDLSLDERKKRRDAYLARRVRGHEASASDNV